MSAKKLLSKFTAFMLSALILAGNMSIPSATAEEEIILSAYDKVGLTLRFCEEYMIEDKYQPDSWALYTNAYFKLKALYEDESATETELLQKRAEFEQIKANMLFADTDTSKNPQPFTFLSGDELVSDMGMGTNLGNTMDGHSNFMPSETSWQSVVTTKEYITALHDAGFNTVRIPVTWGQMINEDFSINQSWINRVQEIVDYCVMQDMYAIINIHHDGAEQSGWLRVAADDIDKVYYKFECTWRTIAEHFKDYDEHLIFESMNEISCMEGDLKNSQEAIDYDTPIIVNLNQIFVNVVRSTGSNNTYRWLASVAHYANAGNHEAFTLPLDAYNTDNRQMFAAHIYKASTNTEWTYEEVYQVVENLKRMDSKFDVPMFLGEYGTRTYPQEGTQSGYNDVARAYFHEIVHHACQTAGVVPIVWDQGFGDDKYERGLYAFWDREEKAPIFKTINDAMARGTFLENSDLNNSYDFTDIKSDPKIIPIKKLEIENKRLELEFGKTINVKYSVSPENTNDVVLWSTSDDTVATVFDGKIKANGIGSCVITAFTQNSDKKQEIILTVIPPSDEIMATSVEADDILLVEGRRAYIAPVLLPENADKRVTYRSSDETVAVVNEMGKVTAKSNGVAFISITASSGVTKTIKVTVCDITKTDEINLSIHALYNDEQKGYFELETGSPVNVTKDGTYTLTLDMSDLSYKAALAGIDSLNYIKELYIKDDDLTNSSTRLSSTQKGVEIKYESIKVNGVSLPITEIGFISAMKGKMFDTQSPINAVDGSIVGGITVENEAVVFDEQNPQSIEITFTLKNVKFVTPEIKTGEKPAESVSAKKDEIKISAIGLEKEIEVSVTPSDSDSKFYFVSQNSSVAYAPHEAVLVKDGKAKVTIFATGAGNTVIYAMSDSSVVAEISVEVKNKSYESYIVTVVGAIVGVSVIAALVIVSAVIVAVKKKAKELSVDTAYES